MEGLVGSCMFQLGRLISYRSVLHLAPQTSAVHDAGIMRGSPAERTYATSALSLAHPQERTHPLHSAAKDVMIRSTPRGACRSM